MNPHFNISLSSTTFSNRPPISYKVREYFEKFIYLNLLEKRNIIVRSKWQILFSISFVEEGPRYKSTHLFLAKNPRTLTKETIKIYEILIPLKLLDNTTDHYLKTIELLFEALTIFFTTNFKRIRKQDMDELWKMVDIQYLLTLPYPAPKIEQKYATDRIDEEGNVIDFIAELRSKGFSV